LLPTPSAFRAGAAPPRLPVTDLLALAEPLDVALLRALDPQRARRNVLRDHRTGAGHRALAHDHRRYEHRVRADLHVVADHGAVFVPSIVVDGHGARPDIHTGSDVRVADVRQVRDL